MTDDLLERTPPCTSDELHGLVRSLGFHVPRVPLVPGHQAPFQYLEHAFFDDRLPRDCVVWANRGGGKTQLGAIATLLDLVFKPGIQVRILGGSFDQASKMYRYLRRLLEDERHAPLVRGNITRHGVELRNGSCVEVLSQSERSVRGQRVHKLRCDELELFEPAVWEAAQLATRSGRCGDAFVPASIEALSTMHRPYGLMQRLVRDAAGAGRALFRWSVIDVMARCEPERACEPCPLWRDCRGRAKQADGFLLVDDAIQQQGRVCAETWQAEMLCLRPKRSDTVYPEFDPAVHVCRDLPRSSGEDAWVAGIDFGFRAPTVLLWAYTADEGKLCVVDELVATECTTEAFIARADARPWPRPSWLGADPAGHARNEHTGVSTITLWKRAGWPVRTRITTIEAGVQAVRARLRTAGGSVRLLVHPRCERLIESLTMYHYPPERPDCAVPVKDGHDHAADALRYLVTNLDRGGRAARVRLY